MFYKILAQNDVAQSRAALLEPYRGEKYVYSTDTILDIETEQISNEFDRGFKGSVIKSSERYTLGRNGWRNFKTNLHTMNAKTSRPADPEKPEEYVFARFVEIDSACKGAIPGAWVDVPDDIHWYQSVDGRVRFLEIPSRLDPAQHLLFIVLGKIPQGGAPEAEWEESVLLLRSNTPYELQANPDRRQRIEDIRAIALQAYKLSLDQGMVEIALPKPYFGEKVIYGRAWKESELTQDDLEQLPDYVKQKAVSYLQAAVEYSFREYCRQQLSHLPDNVQINVADCLAELLETVRGESSVEAGEILTKYLGAYIQEKEPFRVFSEISIFASLNVKLLADSTVTPWETINKYIQKYESSVALMPDSKAADTLKIPLNYLRFIRKSFVYGEEQQIHPGSVVFGQDISSTQIYNYIEHGAVSGAVALGASDQSHAYIVADGLDFPLLVGLPPSIMQYISRGAQTAFYGSRLLINPGPEDLVVLAENAARSGAISGYFSQQFYKGVKLTAGSRPTKLKENTANRKEKDQEPALQNYTDSIGLFRMEFELSAQGRILNSREWLGILRAALKSHPAGITFRTLDEGRDKEPINDLPAILPGQTIYEYLFLPQNQAVREAQAEYMRAIFMLAAEQPAAQLEIIYPMIRSKEELDNYHAVFFAPLQAEFPQAKVREGVMIETPGAVASLGAILKAVDCVSIGSNDLTMSIVGKKERKDISSLDGLQYGVLDTIRTIIQQSKARGKPVEICGDMAGNPVIACILLALGQVDLSMKNKSIPFVQAAIQYLEAKNLFPKITQLIAEMLDPGADKQMTGLELYTAVLELFKDDVMLTELLTDRYYLNP
ncbi:MAG: hypothetical protein LBQ83_01870 [Candidatus Margulisbacteria bacterium]|jgi:phosphoenolpyruvate-protein kinase (PTS system EI component)|nr:hypothetical protein [Candidatus Margulisiibacteriota bacterium]